MTFKQHTACLSCAIKRGQRKLCRVAFSLLGLGGFIWLTWR